MKELEQNFLKQNQINDKEKILCDLMFKADNEEIKFLSIKIKML